MFSWSYKLVFKKQKGFSSYLIYSVTSMAEITIYKCDAEKESKILCENVFQTK